MELVSSVISGKMYWCMGLRGEENLSFLLMFFIVFWFWKNGFVFLGCFDKEMGFIWVFGVIDDL